MDLPNNWDQVETEYNNHYDPCEDDKCLICSGEYEQNSEDRHLLECTSCGYQLIIK